MAGASQYEDGEPGGGMISDINVTPLVDITLVLLIIFMVTAQLIVEKDRGIAIERPKTASGQEVAVKLRITIDAERVLYVDGTSFQDSEKARLAVAAVVSEDPDVKAVISADVNVPHGDVMRAIDMVKQGGVTRFALASDPLGAKTESGP